MSDEAGGRTSPDKPPSSPQAGRGAGGESRIRKIISGIASVLRRGKAEKPEHRIGDADMDLAMERNYLAAERTLMAWIRTSLSMISFGFTIGKLGQVLESIEVKGILGRTRMISVEGIAYFLVILGTAALLGAILQHWHQVRELQAMGLHRRLSITFMVALLLAVLGGFALSSLVLAL
jgi:putative membrane protein